MLPLLPLEYLRNQESLIVEATAILEGISENIVQLYCIRLNLEPRYNVSHLKLHQASKAIARASGGLPTGWIIF